MSGMRQRGAGLTARDVGVKAEDSGGFRSFVSQNLSKVDMYPKLKPDVQIKTKNGAYLSLAVGFLMLLLLFSETYQYLSITQHDVISIDTLMNQRLAINVNITFWGLDCSKVDLVAMDVAGEHQLHIDHDMHKVRLAEHTFEPVGDKMMLTINRNGTEVVDEVEPLPEDYCGSCYGAGKEGQCCNTCEELKEAYSTKGWAAASIDGDKSEQCKRVLEHPGLAAHPGEGCNLFGSLHVTKVAGNFHVALGTTKSVDGRLIHAFERADLTHFNTSHTVHHLSFGEAFDQQVNPLSGAERMLDPAVGPSGVYQYYIKLVPFSYGQYGSEGNPLLSYQYSYTEKFVAVTNDYALTALPGVFFIYDYSPFMVERKDHARSFISYLTRVFAIIGGMFKLSGLLDSALFRLSAMRRGGSSGI